MSLPSVTKYGKPYYQLNIADLKLENATKVMPYDRVIAYKQEDGNWFVYHIDNSEDAILPKNLITFPTEIMSDAEFTKRYTAKDDSDYSDYNTIQGGQLFENMGPEMTAFNVPFDFTMTDSFGKERFMDRGDYLLFWERKNKGTEIYAMQGAKHREAGKMEKNFAIIGHHDRGSMNLAFKHVLRADRSPVAGIQFNNVDLAQAYDRLGKNQMTEMLR